MTNSQTCQWKLSVQERYVYYSLPCYEPWSLSKRTFGHVDVDQHSEPWAPCHYSPNWKKVINKWKFTGKKTKAASLSTTDEAVRLCVLLLWHGRLYKNETMYAHVLDISRIYISLVQYFRYEYNYVYTMVKVENCMLQMLEGWKRSWGSSVEVVKL